MMKYKTFLNTSLKKILEESKQDSVVFTIMRCNPITKGHEENVRYGEKIAREKDAQYILFTTQTHDGQKNPLDFDTKVKYLKKFFDVNVSADKTLKTPWQILEALAKKFKNIYFIVGEDRVEEFQRMHNYTEKLGIEHLEVLESGKRQAGVSGTDMRNYVKLNQFNKFKDNLPSKATDQDAKELFDAVKTGLKIS